MTDLVLGYCLLVMDDNLFIVKHYRRLFDRCSYKYFTKYSCFTTICYASMTQLDILGRAPYQYRQVFSRQKLPNINLFNPFFLLMKFIIE